MCVGAVIVSVRAKWKLTFLGINGPKIPCKKETERVVKEVKDAFINTGFLYVKNHGIPKQNVSLISHTKSIV